MIDPARYAGVSGDLSFVDGPDGPIVVKRALPKLKVAADWFASPERSAVEARCLQVLAEVLGQDAFRAKYLDVSESEYQAAVMA